MRKLIYLLPAALTMTIAAPTVFAQLQVLEEIVVTARKREESLQEVPVSISVISADLIREAGILNPRDIFDAVPGLDYDEAVDRNSANPAIRGIQSSAVATTRQKVMSFIDGLPQVGAQGTLQLAGVERVEIFRGPQSAAFGRATFGGAINYVTRDPGDEFEGDVRLQTSDLGRNALEVLLAGPISDTVGFTLNVNLDEYDGPDEWVTTDGYQVGGQETQYFNGKLKFTPSDSFDAEISFSHLETDDDVPVEYFISAAEWASCTNLPAVNPMAMGVRWIDGTFDCSTATPPGGLPQNNDTVAPFLGTADEQLASAYLVDPTLINEKDRLQAEFNWGLDNDTTLQVLGFIGEERYLRWRDGDRSDTPLSIAGGMVMGMAVNHMADPTDIEEQMVEVRWLSPDDQRLRWMAGASVYDYEFLTLVWSQYNAILGGFADQITPPVVPNVIIAEDSQNIGLFGGLTYDITDRTTLSLEGRFQTEDLTNENAVTGESFTNSTDSFLPRIAITHTLDNNVTLYGQLAQGNNPAGVIPAAGSPRLIATHAQATQLGLINWLLESTLRYDEEVITNLEFGIKANLADNRVALTSAVYVMDWEHYNQPFTLVWNVDQLWAQSGNPGPSPGLLPGFGPGDYRLRAQLDSGDASVLGWENELRWFVNDAWTVGGTLTWQDTQYDDFCSPSAVQDVGLLPTAIVTDGSGVPFDCVSVVGNSLTRQPDLTYTLNATYRGAVGDTGWNWVARVDWRSIGEQYLDDVELMALPVTAMAPCQGCRTMRKTF